MVYCVVDDSFDKMHNVINVKIYDLNNFIQNGIRVHINY